ncbi:MAG: hypothetical protein JST66_06910 [Bacteroidetes bacterium]|nr:hypothetical protein [Bacteroidota bacterium]
MDTYFIEVAVLCDGRSTQFIKRQDRPVVPGGSEDLHGHPLTIQRVEDDGTGRVYAHASLEVSPSELDALLQACRYDQPWEAEPVTCSGGCDDDR